MEAITTESFLSRRGPEIETEALDDVSFARRLDRLSRVLFTQAHTRWSSVMMPHLRRRLLPWMKEGERPTGREVFREVMEICCTHRLPDGETLVESFADSTPGLSSEERTALRRFTAFRYSAFEVAEELDDRLRVIDLAFRRQQRDRQLTVIPAGEWPPAGTIGKDAIIFMWMVPVRTFFVPLGAFQVIPASARDHVVSQMQARTGKRGIWSHLEHRQKRDRWVPTAADPIPGPQDPCPCASGRRYKKCCMAR